MGTGFFNTTHLTKKSYFKELAISIIKRRQNIFFAGYLAFEIQKQVFIKTYTIKDKKY